MPSSRSTRKGIKWGKTAAAAEHRLREEMGLSPRGPADDPYVSPEQRERNKKQRAALRATFAGLPLAERRRRATEFQEQLRPLCLSHRAFIGAWTANFEPLLDGTSVPIRASGRHEPHTGSAATSTSGRSKKSGSTQPPNQTAKTRPPKKSKLTADGAMHVAAFEALLRHLDPAELEAIRRAVEAFVRNAPNDTHKAVRAGVGKIATALAAELRSR